MKCKMLVLTLCVLMGLSMFVSAASAADQSLQGVTLIVVNNAGGNSDSMKQFAEPWEKMTGATVEMNPIPFGDIKDKILAAVSTNTFIADVFVVPSGISGDLITGGYIMEVPEAARQELKFDDLLDSYREMNMKWGDKFYAWPWDGDLHMLNYRKDLLDDPKNKEAFKKEFGYDLDVPKTWPQYTDIAKFFTGTGRGVDYGWAEVSGRKNGSFHAFSDRAVGYAKHPDDQAFYFDPETMDARINNPGFVKAMEDWVAAIPYAPSDVTTYGYFETAQSFVTGQSALCVNWTDVGVLANDPDNSVVMGGKASYAVLPGSSDVYNSKTGQWEKFEKPNQPGYAAFGGWIVMIPKNAKQPEAAMSFAKYLGNPDVMTKISQTPLSGVNPARKSTLNDLAGWIENAKFPTEENAKAYTQAQIDSLGQTNVVFQLRIPGYAQYEDALELAISEALTKQKSPKDALDIAAKTWNEITDRLGREKQLGFYRASIGLAAK